MHEVQFYQSTAFIIPMSNSLGARHDGFDTAIACPPSGYIMAAYAESPTAASENTFWTFSNCSVNGFISHLAAMRLTIYFCSDGNILE